MGTYLIGGHYLHKYSLWVDKQVRAMLPPSLASFFLRNLCYTSFSCLIAWATTVKTVVLNLAFPLEL